MIYLEKREEIFKKTLDNGLAYGILLLERKEQTMLKSELTLRDHAEQWWMQHGGIIPPRNTQAYQDMYERWVEFAFVVDGS